MTNSSAFNKLVKEITTARDEAKAVAIPAMRSEPLEQLRARWAFIDALEQVLNNAAKIRRESGVEEEEVQ